MLMVGDHSDDIICGQRAGTMTCLVEQHTNVDERYHADFNVVDMHHLLNILKGVWANR
jgi:phosphoglycolate phosphatase-like HAD superfamily hydrolase